MLCPKCGGFELLTENEECTMKQFMIEQAKPQDAALLLDYTKAIGGETDNLSFGAEDIHIHVEEKATPQPHHAFRTAMPNSPR